LPVGHVYYQCGIKALNCLIQPQMLLLLRVFS
jgi:hypothetical protein